MGEIAEGEETINTLTLELLSSTCIVSLGDGYSSVVEQSTADQEKTPHLSSTLDESVFLMSYVAVLDDWT